MREDRISKFMTNEIKTSRKFFFLIFLMSSLLVLIGLISIWKINKINQTVQVSYADSLLPVNQLANARYLYSAGILTTVQQANSKQLSYSEARKKIQQAQYGIASNWKMYLLTSLTKEEKKQAYQTAILMDSFDKMVEKLKLILKEEDSLALENIISNELFPSLNPILLKITNLINLQIKVGKNKYKNNLEFYNESTRQLSLLIITALVFGIPFSYYLLKKINNTVVSFNESTKKLAAVELNYRTLIKYAGDAILILNENTQIIDSNDQASQLFGYSRKELLLLKISDIVPPSELKNKKVNFETVGKKKSSLIHRKIVRKDGTVLDAEINNRLIESKSSFVIIRDVTERKKVEYNLKKSEEKYRYLFDNNPAFIIIWDLETLGVLEVNNAVYEKYGYDKEEWMNMSIIQIRPEEYRQEIKDFAKRLLNSNESIVKRAWRHTMKNGQVMLMEISSHRIDYNNRKAVLALGRDVTEQVKAETELIRFNAELKKTNTELDRFVYSTSHDLRSPLKSMLGLIHLTKDGINPEDVELYDRLQMLGDSVLKLDNFIENILNYSKNSRNELNLEEINFEKLVHEIKESHEFIHLTNKLNFQVSVNSKGKFVSDKTRLNIVLNNIVSNAIKYRDTSKETSFINISITYNNTNAIIIIEDNGIGITDNNKLKVFDMFYRGTSLSTGSGLGLYIVKETIEKLGGKITLESEFNKGTKFIIEITNQVIPLN